MLFILQYWKQALLAVLLCTALYYKHLSNKYVTELATFKAEIATLAAAEKAINAQKVQTAHIIAANAQKAYSADIARLGLDRAKLKKELSNEKGNITTMLDHAYSMRVNSASSMREVSKPSIPSTEGNGNSDTIITLVNACKLTTIEYNALYQAWVDNCKIYECE